MCGFEKSLEKEKKGNYKNPKQYAEKEGGWCDRNRSSH